MDGREGKSYWISIMRSKHDTNFFNFFTCSTLYAWERRIWGMGLVVIGWVAVDGM
jgi:hypothetical protein